MEIVAGQNIYAAIEGMKAHEVPKSQIPGREQYFDSDSLCAFQAKLSTMGYTGAEIVESIYGFGVRYNSGLDNFRIIYSPRGTDGEYEAALEWAKEWQSRDSKKRYVTFRGDSKARSMHPAMASEKHQMLTA